MPIENKGRGTSETTAKRKAERSKISNRHFISKEELAIELGISPRTVDNWMAQKRIPYLRLTPRMVRFNLERVKTALDRYEVREIGRTN